MKAGGDVDLNEPWLEAGVEQDVEAEELVAGVPGVAEQLITLHSLQPYATCC